MKQFVAAFGAVTAAEAIAQVDGVLGCDGYRARDGEHTRVRKVPVGALSETDARTMFCETVNGSQHVCTVLLSREDVLTRFQVRASDDDTARTTALELAAMGAKKLAAVW